MSLMFVSDSFRILILESECCILAAKCLCIWRPRRFCIGYTTIMQPIPMSPYHFNLKQMTIVVAINSKGVQTAMNAYCMSISIYAKSPDIILNSFPIFADCTCWFVMLLTFLYSRSISPCLAAVDSASSKYEYLFLQMRAKNSNPKRSSAYKAEFS